MSGSYKCKMILGEGIPMIQNRMLNSYEKSWIEKMLSSNFKQRKEIVRQITQAEILREYTDYYLSIKFIAECAAKNCSGSTGVPVEMRVYLKNKVPIQFLLHIKKGIVTELEVFYADSSKISGEISLDNVRTEIIIDSAWKY